MAQLKQIMQKALADSAFRAELVKNPGNAAKDMGIDLTPEQAEKLKNIDTRSMVDIVEKMLSF